MNEGGLNSRPPSHVTHRVEFLDQWNPCHQHIAVLSLGQC